jgi:hypothetical protein
MNFSVKHPTKVMVWGCMAASGVGILHIIQGMVNGPKYIYILENIMLSSARGLFHGEYFFQDDNAPCHRAKSVTEWKKRNECQTIEWPAQSPDLNPIENLWCKVSIEIAKKGPRNKQELVESLLTAWYRIITREHLVKLVHSMPERCRLVKKSKGWPIKY